MYCPLIKESLMVPVCPVRCLYRHEKTRACMYEEVKKLDEGDIEGYAQVTGKTFDVDEVASYRKRIQSILVANQYSEYTSIRDPLKWNKRHYELWRSKSEVTLSFEEVVEYALILKGKRNG